MMYRLNTSYLTFHLRQLVRCEMSSKWRERAQGRREVVWSMFPQQFYRRRMSTTVSSQHIRVYQCKGRLFRHLGHHAPCAAIERLHSTVDIEPRFWIGGMLGSSGRLLVVFQTWRQSKKLSVWRAWAIQMVSKRGPSKMSSFLVRGVYLTVACVCEHVYKKIPIIWGLGNEMMQAGDDDLAIAFSLKISLRMIARADLFFHPEKRT